MSMLTSFELFLEFFELCNEALNLSRESLYLFFKFGDAIGFVLSTHRSRRRRLSGGFKHGLASEQMRESRIFLARLTWQFHDKRIGFARAQLVHHFINFFHAFEVIKPRAAGANLADGLWSTQHQHTHHRKF